MAETRKDLSDVTRISQNEIAEMYDHYKSLRQEADKFREIQEDISESLRKTNKLSADLSKMEAFREKLINSLVNGTSKNVNLTKDNLMMLQKMTAIKEEQLRFSQDMTEALKKQYSILKMSDSISDDLTNKMFGPLKGILSKLPGGGRIFTHMFGGMEEKMKRGIGDAVTKMVANIGKGVTPMKAMAAASGEMGSAIMSAGGPLLIIVGLLIMAVQLFLKMDKAAEDFRKTTGLTISQTEGLQKEAERVSIEYAHMGVTIEGAYTAAAALTSTFGDNVKFAQKNTEFVALMRTNLGVAEEDSAKVLQNFMGMSGMSAETAQNLSLYASRLSEAGGVSFPKVMNDISKASSRTLGFLRGNPIALVKAAVEARRLGASLESVSGSAESLLDFEGSFNKEMELSTLLGRNVNLMEMRRLSFAGDLAGLAKEQNRFLQEQGDISKLNVFQVKAMAEAMGLTVEELVKRNAQQQLINKLTGPEKAAYEKELAIVNDIRDVKQLSLMDDLKKQKIQAQQTQMMNEFKAIGMELASVLLPIVQAIAKVLVPALQSIGSILRSDIGKGILEAGVAVYAIFKMVGYMNTAISKLIQLIPGAGRVLGVGLRNFSGLSRIIGGFNGILSSMFGGLTRMIGRLSFKGLAASIGKIIRMIGGLSFKGLAASIGKIIPPLIFVYEIFKNFFKYWESMVDAFSKGDWAAGIENLGKMLFKSVYDTVNALSFGLLDWLLGGFDIDYFVKFWQGMIDPIMDSILSAFDTVKEKIMSFFGGKSPSELGLSIVDGLTSVGGMLIDALISPFKSAWDLIKKIPFIGKLFGSKTSDISVDVSKDAEKTNPTVDILTTISGKLNDIVIMLQGISVGLASAAIVGNAKGAVSDVGNVIGSVMGLNEEPIPETKSITPNNKDIVDKLEELISLMKAGGISVNLDGRKVSSMLAQAVNI